MRNRWDPRATRRLSPLAELVYRSRLIGDEPTLGLFGGGNTSTKCEELDLLGRPQPVLWIKGSGASLRHCEAKHFAPLPMAPLGRLAERDRMSDEEMVSFLERCLLDPKAPRPSIETLLHAFIPEGDIDHTHADAILALANTRDGRQLVRQVLGPDLLWIPYLQPGFELSKRVYEAYRRQPTARGAVLEKHGLITWGLDGEASYRRTVFYVSRAERYLADRRRQRVWSVAGCRSLPPSERLTVLRRWLPAIRRTISIQKKMCLTFQEAPDVLEFVNAKRLLKLARIGPATPDHLLRTKRVPLIVELNGRKASALPGEVVARQLERYAAEHKRYFLKCHRSGQALQDPYPRVILMPGVGMLTSGKDLTEAEMVAEIYTHTMAIIRNATSVGRYTSVSLREAFNVEYWPLELYKLTLAPPEAELAREIGLVTGAAGGIGRAIARHLVDRGASVAVTDLDPAKVEGLADELNRRAGRRRALGLVMDVTDEASIEQAFDQIAKTFGGLDFVVSNAGVAAVAPIDRLPRSEWDRHLAVNATGHFLVSRAAVRWLRSQGLGGAIVFIASKNVLAPGKDFGAYSAAKAAQTQLARILAIESGECGVRVNIVNPDGVFEGSGLWEAIKADRAKTYGLSPNKLEAYYQERNLLKTRILPDDVAEAVAFLVSRRSAKTTGCILTVDGGLREAFPR